MPTNESIWGHPYGRKRQFVVDTQADFHAAHQAEGPVAIFLIGAILWRAGERLEKSKVINLILAFLPRG